MTDLTDTSWLELFPDAVVLVDSGGVIRYANRMCDTLLGWRAEELQGRPMECLVPGRVSDHSRLRESYMANPSHRPMASGMELTALHRDGHEVPVDIALRPLQMGGRGQVLVAMRDVSASRAAQQKVRLLSVAIDAAASGVLVTDADGVIVRVNPAVCRMTGYSPDELIGARPSLLKSGRHDAGFYARLWATLRAGEVWHGDIVNRRKDGSEYFEEQTIAPVKDERGRISHYIAIKQDVTERVRAARELREARDELAQRIAEIERLHEQLREQSIRCPLTGLYNRRYFDEILQRELTRAAQAGIPACLAMIDIDHFKQLNDQHGHAVGDRFLAELGRVLLADNRAQDLAFRYGGEEFAVIMTASESLDGARQLETWRRRYSGVEVAVSCGVVRSTFSAGIAQHRPGESPSELFARADAALYAAKRSGRNRLVQALPPVREQERDKGPG